MTPSFWHAHYVFPAAVFFVSLGMALGIAHFSSFKPGQALATASDNICGFAWAPTIGWISLNNQTCSSGVTGGTYGVNMATTLSGQPGGVQGYALNGFGWSDNVGWVCFGASCNVPECEPSAPADPGYFYAYVNKLTDGNYKEVHGWAGICNQKELGWISLNCADPVANACVGGNTTFYKLVYNPADHNFHNAAAQGSPFAWSGNSDGTGVGYINFFANAAEGMQLKIAPEADPFCADGLDNDLNGLKDCADPGCIATPACVAAALEINSLGAGLVNQYQACHDTLDNNANNQIDCAGFGGKPPDDSCLFTPVCSEGNYCSNGLDDDGNGFIDCSDPACAGDPACFAPIPPQSQCTAFAGNPDQKNLCCSDNSTNGQPLLDCLDPDCRTNAAVCSAWTQVLSGNVYAGGGITGTKAPKEAGVSNAAYCLRSNGAIDWTSADAFAVCKESAAGNIPLPSMDTKYRNVLGFLDLAGIRNGRYGTVINITDAAQIPDMLNGRIYRFTGPGTFILPAKNFKNGTGAEEGSGLLLIEGADLEISGDINYLAVPPVQSRLKNLSSFGVIAVKDAFGTGGNIKIDANVQKVSGTYFAEGTIQTGTSGGADQYLQLMGIYVARKFDLQRQNNSDPTKPAEEFVFDGRAVVNPPPGMQDIGQSLPKQTDANF